MIPTGKFIDLTGQRFGRLTVIERAGSTKNKAAVWRCRCDCGKETKCCSNSLRQGGIVSCGCKLRENAGLLNKTHGMTNTRLYKTWRNMISRCYNSNVEKYDHYGGRGIKVCKEWRSFENFRDWAVKTGYTDELTIDRIDVNGNYSPENCRWATQQEQKNNKRNNRLITYNGETHTMADWSRILGIRYSLIKDRLRWGWTIERAFTEPTKRKREL